MPVLVDFNQVVISNLHVQAKNLDNKIVPEEVRKMVLTSIKRYRNKFLRSHGELVICTDAPRSWRKDVFPPYKENRKLKRSKSLLNWDDITAVVAMLVGELTEHFPYKVLAVHKAEADDIIAALCKKLHQGGPVKILSGDKDFKQLQYHPNITQYNPVKDIDMRESNPKRYLFEHVLRGDENDGIPNFLSDDDTFINKTKRQKSLYEIKMNEWLHDPSLVLADPAHKRNITRNRRIIDLTKIPQEIEDAILEAWEQPPMGKRRNLLNYFMKHRLDTLISDIGEF